MKKIFADKFLLLNQIIFLLFCLFLYGEFAYKITAVKNIALYLAFALLLAGIFWKAKYYEELFKENFKKNYLLIILLFAFLLYALTISYFSYSGNILTFKKALAQFSRAWIAIFLALSIKVSEKKARFVFFLLLFVFISTTIYDARRYLDFAHLDAHLKSTDFIKKTRMYARFVDLFLVFGIFGFFLVKNWFLKILIFLSGILLPLAMLILTGARGAYLSALFTIFASIFFLFFTKFFKNKKVVFFSLFVIISASSYFSYYAYHHYPRIKYKMTQKTSSGRDIILEDRLPLFLKSERAYYGLGFVPNAHAKYSEYDAFLKDKEKEGKRIRLAYYDKDKQKYWAHDEPTYLGYLFEYGYLGTGIFVLLSLTILGSSLRNFFRTRSLLFASIFISFSSYYLLRGLFETQPIFYAFYLAIVLLLMDKMKVYKKV